MTDYYVILTGSKSNAGDFLIKYRAKALFNELRPDRGIVDYNAWEELDQEKLEIINKSKCLILMGGPSLQKGMYPSIYKLTENLGNIKVPIATMGIGWKSMRGNWSDTYEYPLTDKTLTLLKRIQKDGLTSSVRDFHTLNVLAMKGFDNFIMTGCPAYYDSDSINKPFTLPSEIKRVAFSLGVSFINSPQMEALMKDQILKLRAHFSDASFEVAFHHSLNANDFLNTHGATEKHNSRHKDFAKWLESKGISYADISGSAENLINYYSDIDLHIGYRVHAHIFLNSIAKMSVLISEDGRAKGSQSAIGGLVVNGYSTYGNSIVKKIIGRVYNDLDRYTSNKYATKEVMNTIDYEFKTQGYKSKLTKITIGYNFALMKKFISCLP